MEGAHRLLTDRDAQVGTTHEAAEEAVLRVGERADHQAHPQTKQGSSSANRDGSLLRLGKRTPTK